MFRRCRSTWCLLFSFIVLLASNCFAASFVTMTVSDAHQRRSRRLMQAAATAAAAAAASKGDGETIPASSKPTMTATTAADSAPRKRKSAPKAASATPVNNNNRKGVKVGGKVMSTKAATKKDAKTSKATKLASSEALDLPKSTKTTNTKATKTVRKLTTLPRTLEESIRTDDPSVQHVLGIDEAGRGPLAGPVVAGAICLPADAILVQGIVDSKKIVQEAAREQLYGQIVSILDATWAIAVIDAATIDDINILQATLLGMRLAAAVVMGHPIDYPVVSEASVAHTGIYVVCSSGPVLCDQSNAVATKTAETDETRPPSPFYALIDGNRLPNEMPCPAKAVVKGDGREYCIAAASILAKVTRDRLMHAYDTLYPAYGLQHHKGYPTVAHMQAVKLHGASPIHRRTFAPLKHMHLDPKTGSILTE